MANLCVAPAPSGDSKLANQPKAGPTYATSGPSGPATLPATGQQWPRPVL